MVLHFKIIGTLSIALASIHFLFPKYLNWGKELKALSLINRQIMAVHTFFIAFFVFLVGLLCLTSGSELIATSLGKKISLGLGLFWVARLLTQFFAYSPDLGKGRDLKQFCTYCFPYFGYT